MYNQFKMRRNGGAVKRADETSPGSYSVNQERTMALMGMAPTNYGMADSPATTTKDEYGTEIPEGFESSTGKEYVITASRGTLEGQQTLLGPRGRNQSPNVTQSSGTKPAEFTEPTTSTTTDNNTTTRTTYGVTKKTQTPGTLDTNFRANRQYDTTTDYRTEELKIKPYKKK